MKEDRIQVRKHVGLCDFSFNTVVSQAQVRQVLEQVADELVKRCGDYRWTLEEVTNRKNNTSEYQIVAWWKDQIFVEGRGKTPKAAMLDFFQLRSILKDRGVELPLSKRKIT